jgi:GMC oxidoreductase/ABC transporter substrate binding protein
VSANMKRREFITLLGGGAAAAWPFAARAQQQAMPRISVLRVAGPVNQPAIEGLRQGLRDLGYIEGQNIAIEFRSGEGGIDRLPELAAELVRLKPAVIVAYGPQAIQAARDATATIPIIMGRMDDADAHGFVTNYSRPSGNITGLSFQSGDLSTKWLELLKDILPPGGRIAALWDIGGTSHQVRLIEQAGSLGIDVVADMPGVGADLQDHLQVRMQYRCTERITMNDVIHSWRHRTGAGLRYVLFRKGLLAIGAGYAGGFFRTSSLVATPDVQVHFIIFSADTAGAAVHSFPGFIASVCQLRPESRGFVRIKSADPRQPPSIQPRYLSSRSDRDIVVAGLKLLRRIMQQPAMRRYVAEERAPDPRCTSDADFLAFAREAGTTVFHPTSTCRMGCDPTAVVDERLRVHGIECLRVVDGSIMPTLVSGNTNAAIVMIAEKGADMILQDAVARAPVSMSA